MIIQRLLNLPGLLKRKSYFLFGPRATGKSFLVRQQLKDIPVINLLRSDLFLRLSANPTEIESIIKAYPQHDTVVIDEVQRIPMLLNEVHRLIEEDQIKFLLTGSSARKLREKGVNLLAGRAREAKLFPLTSHEIPDFNLEKYLQYGGLPPVYLSNEPEEELHAYVNTFLKEEIQAESLVRKIAGFSRFLQIAALTSGQIINFSKIANDAGLPPSTIREYYHVLEDTFIGFMLPAYTQSKKRKAISTAKFYLFDIGVKNSLAGIRQLPPQSDLYGHAFEHFIAMELTAYLSYSESKQPLTYWRSKHGHEVDFIIGDKIAIEVKSGLQTKDRHFKGLQTFAEEKICSRHILVSQDPINRKYDTVETLYWKDFLDLLWSNKIV